MTTEEKARAYDEALKRADSLTEKYGGRDFAEYIFPELKESDDERIRKALYEFISDTLGDEFDGYDFNKREALAYLEKQKAKDEEEIPVIPKSPTPL